MRSLALIALLAVLAPCMPAQRTLSPAPPFASGQPPGAGVGSMGRVHGRGSDPRHFLYPFGLFADPFYSDAVASTGYPVEAQPPVIIVQNPAGVDPAAQPSPAPSQPLMIELQGDRYVRVSGDDTSTAQMIDQKVKQKDQRNLQPLARPAQSSDETLGAAPDLPPVDLIFRDGHHEPVSAYTIANGILYTAGDYYASGSWNKQIELTSLNLAETINSNRARGVAFQLPTAPNEVIVRP